MRRIHWSLPVLFPLLTLLAAPVSAQEPDPPTPPTGTERAETRPDPGRRGGRRQGRGGRRGQRAPVVAIQAGFVHPVSGPVIEKGVILLRGERILAIGAQGEVEIPESATVRDFPTGHVYPGLIDAETDAFTDPATATASLDAGLGLADDLQLRGNRDDELAAAGITVAYVAAQSGQGVIVRPRKDGFEIWAGKEKAALQLRMTRGPTPTHALQRQQQLDGQLKTFDGLEKYTKAKEDYTKALDKYATDFEAYLEYHEKNKGKKPAATPGATPPSGERPTPGSGREGRRGRGRRGGPPGGGQPGEGTAEGEELELALEQLVIALLESEGAQDPKPTPKKQEPKPGSAKQGDKGPSGADKPKSDKPPARPKYPKAPREDPAKEALLAVLDGKLPLRVEAHRPDELRAALKLQRDQDIPVLVLEQAYGAASITAELASTGTAVVLTNVLPNSMPKLYEAFDPCELPKVLHDAGVPFAIATGRARRAPLLPLMAATAVGRGLDRSAALRAITLTAAEILGIQKDTGSLQRGKYADLVVFDRPMFQSDSHVLLVLGKGRTEYEVK